MKRTTRSGFTLVEILVALALTLFVLSVLSQAFVAGADAFHALKAVGDMNDGLRVAATALRSDLSLNHFEGNRRLSDSMFWTAPEFGPPKQGYLFVYQGPVPALLTTDPQYEGTDSNGLPSYRRTNHAIAGTSRVNGAMPQSFYSCRVPNGSPLLSVASGLVDARYQVAPPATGNWATFNSQWIEWCYFLAPMQGNPTAAGTPLYGLYRQQRLVVSDVDTLNWSTTTTQKVAYSAQSYYPSLVSCGKNPSSTGYFYFSSPADLTIPNRRASGVFNYNRTNTAAAATLPAYTPTTYGTPFSPLVNPTTSQPTGEDLLLTYVISFDVKVLIGTPNNAASGGGFTVQGDFSDLVTAGSVNPGYFDSWSSRIDDVYNYSNATQIPNPINILALKITIRVWDPSTQFARQVSIVQEL
jgi:prepilin-type N-terminal cleavage/methylation domain-containing protein